MKARLLNADAETFKVVCTEVTLEEMHGGLPWQFTQDRYSLGAYVQVVSFTDVLGKEHQWWEPIDVFAVCISMTEPEYRHKRKAYHKTSKLSGVNAISLMPFIKSERFISDQEIYANIDAKQLLKDYEDSAAVYETLEKLSVNVYSTLSLHGATYQLDIDYVIRRFQEGMYGHRFEFGYPTSVKVNGVALQEADLTSAIKEEILSVVSIHDRYNVDEVITHYIRLQTGGALYLSKEDFPDGWALITGDPAAPLPAKTSQTVQDPCTGKDGGSGRIPYTSQSA